MRVPAVCSFAGSNVALRSHYLVHQGSEESEDEHAPAAVPPPLAATVPQAAQRDARVGDQGVAATLFTDPPAKPMRLEQSAPAGAAAADAHPASDVNYQGGAAVNARPGNDQGTQSVGGQRGAAADTHTGSGQRGAAASAAEGGRGVRQQLWLPAAVKECDDLLGPLLALQAPAPCSSISSSITVPVVVAADAAPGNGQGGSATGASPSPNGGVEESLPAGAVLEEPFEMRQAALALMQYLHAVAQDSSSSSTVLAGVAAGAAMGNGQGGSSAGTAPSPNGGMEELLPADAVLEELIEEFELQDAASSRLLLSRGCFAAAQPAASLISFNSQDLANETLAPFKVDFETEFTRVMAESASWLRSMAQAQEQDLGSMPRQCELLNRTGVHDPLVVEVEHLDCQELQEHLGPQLFCEVVTAACDKNPALLPHAIALLRMCASPGGIDLVLNMANAAQVGHSDLVFTLTQVWEADQELVFFIMHLMRRNEGLELTLAKAWQADCAPMAQTLMRMFKCGLTVLVDTTAQIYEAGVTILAVAITSMVHDDHSGLTLTLGQMWKAGFQLDTLMLLQLWQAGCEDRVYLLAHSYHLEPLTEELGSGTCDYLRSAQLVNVITALLYTSTNASAAAQFSTIIEPAVSVMLRQLVGAPVHITAWHMVVVAVAGCYNTLIDRWDPAEMVALGDMLLANPALEIVVSHTRDDVVDGVATVTNLAGFLLMFHTVQQLQEQQQEQQQQQQAAASGACHSWSHLLAGHHVQSLSEVELLAAA
ncbi:hypothetical protein FOA52_000623 [Chlamydomonas sp. UWO 241]|nr:hypothetical protein FOA52_000623 [Chlamydomonas sp. UWO 241]